VKILLVHRFLPGRFGVLAQALFERGDTCVFLHAEGEEAPPGVRSVRFIPSRPADLGDDRRMRPLETAVLDGEAAFRAARSLAASGFRPDVIVAQGGFGPGLHLAEAFRGVPLLGAFEWFDPDPAARAQLRLELAACRLGLVESRVQLAEFPAAAQSKLRMVHAGIDTRVWAPVRARGAARAELGLGRDDEVLVHAGPIFQPQRGCDTVLAALGVLQERRPRLQICLVGEAGGLYGPPMAEDAARRAAMRAGLAALDRGRLRVATGCTAEFRRIALQAADATIYFADGCPVSMALLEAMACAVPIVASDTAAVREFLVDGQNALLAPFGDAGSLVGAVERLFEDRYASLEMGRAARRQAVLQHGLPAQVARQIACVDELVRGAGRPASAHAPVARSA
jgi:glycosyltransferase involved in cell wall biosynthesis